MEDRRYDDTVENPKDRGGFLWGLLGCCIPVVGLVLFLVWRDEKPKTAKAAGIGALVSVILTHLCRCIRYVHCYGSADWRNVRSKRGWGVSFGSFFAVMPVRTVPFTGTENRFLSVPDVRGSWPA